MTQKDDSKIIEVVHSICCGLDVHKKKISACVIFPDKDGADQFEIKEFRTFTDDLQRLRSWLLEHDCPVVAMESTGIYWRPVHNVLEDVVQVTLVNARDIKNVPGRKTDIGDSKWLAGLLRHGLLRGSFIPSKAVREWRDLTRLRKKYVQTVGDYKKRTHKLFESANIKIDSVVSDLFGVTGRNLMNLLVSGRQSLKLLDIQGCVRGKLRGKEEELYRSIQGFFSDHHRFILKRLLKTVVMLEKEIVGFDKQIRKLMKDQKEVLERMKKAAGISNVSACDILAELGPDLSGFRKDAALASWSGLCPGNNESAGKRKSGRSPVRKHHLKTIMVEVAWAAVKKKGSYFKDKYYRLKARRGAKKAIVAIAHRIMLGIYHVIKDGVEFRDLGEDYLTQRNKSQKLSYLRRQAHLMGYNIVAQAT
ncbi:MAG: IS110 family transposase [Thermodesulfobacteriota bacterium]|nr:IS110 family transposase [Thermodesulfobacteriota bacterium]